MKFKVQDPYFMITIKLKEEKSIELGPFSVDREYEIKRYGSLF